ARVVGDAQEIYGQRIPVDDAIRRIEGLYKPYHRALRRLFTRVHRDFVAAVVETVESTLRAQGYSVSRNKPYAGGFITEHYGNPAAGLHAIQLELNRALYMDERRFERSPSFARLAHDLETL